MQLATETVDASARSNFTMGFTVVNVSDRDFIYGYTGVRALIELTRDDQPHWSNECGYIFTQEFTSERLRPGEQLDVAATYPRDEGAYADTEDQCPVEPGSYTLAARMFWCPNGRPSGEQASNYQCGDPEQITTNAIRVTLR